MFSTIALSERASLTVFANLICVVLVCGMAKYFLPISIPSGVLPSSLKIRIDSPLSKL